jgi:hypothetical protein
MTLVTTGKAAVGEKHLAGGAPAHQPGKDPRGDGGPVDVLDRAVRVPDDITCSGRGAFLLNAAADLGRAGQCFLQVPAGRTAASPRKRRTQPCAGPGRLLPDGARERFAQCPYGGVG